MDRKASAIFSHCAVHPDCCDAACLGRLYRYLLKWPTGLENDRVALGIFANPSTATAEHLDPTLTWWRNFCHAWGYGWSWTVNVRAWRATDPKDVPPNPIGVGDDNRRWISSSVRYADLIVCGWGHLGADLAPWALGIIRDQGKVAHCLRLNKDGSPAHPLYLPRGLVPVVFGP